jgi:hypothetical protein
VRLYRVVKTNPPTRSDFVSHYERGIPPPVRVPDAERLMRGLSVFNRADLARQQARRFPRLGRFVAEMDIPDDGSIPVERTGAAEGHHTVWGTPEELLARVTWVEKI